MALGVFSVPVSGTLRAQAPTPAGQERAEENARVFLDCTNFYCDFDYLRREIRFVNWVRDRQDAQVHVLGTAQRTGGGGREFTFTFIGQRDFAGRQDTLRHVSRDQDTDDEVRRGLARVLKLGLVPYVAGTPVGARLSVSYQGPGEGAAAAAQPAHDPWDYWIFRTRVGGFFNGEERLGSISLNAGISAGRTTETLKIQLGVNGSYRRQSFEFEEGERFVNINRSYGVNAMMVWSLGPRWSTGFRTSGSSSTFFNQDLAVRGGPAIEYNIYPYDESTRRQLTIQYSVGPAAFDYQEETIFDQTSEVLAAHSLEVAVSVRQPWGTVTTSLDASQFLHDLEKHRIGLFGGVSLRVFKGLEFNLSGNVARIKDQLYLARGELTREEILVRRRQLGTDFEYFGNIGLSYRFGSIFNNVVNPRFERGGPMFFFF